MGEIILPDIKSGQRIMVLNERHQELGEGTFLRSTRHEEMDTIAYECEEHTILAKGNHYLRLAGRVHFVQTRLA